MWFVVYPCFAELLCFVRGDVALALSMFLLSCNLAVWSFPGAYVLFIFDVSFVRKYCPIYWKKGYISCKKKKFYLCPKKDVISLSKLKCI